MAQKTFPQSKTIGKTHLILEIGNIVSASANLVVNAANPFLAPGAGVCGAFARSAGPAIFKECQEILKGLNRSHIETGEAVLTSKGNLTGEKIQGIVHAAGPDCRNPDENKHRQSLLKKTYMSCLQHASGFYDQRYISPVLEKEEIYRSIAFPSISTGIYNYPLQEAARVALSSIREFIEDYPNALEEIRFVFLDPASIGDTSIFSYSEELEQIIN